MNKKVFEEVELQVIGFDKNDIITTSTTSESDGIEDTGTDSGDPE